VSTSTDEVTGIAASDHGMRFERALLKLSGEALLGPREYGIDPKTVVAISGTAPPPTMPACWRRS
jgi:hypothetical protein